MMIPHVIHYCWFGVHPKPQNIEDYINGWKEKLPKYQFVEWNESNFDVKNSIPYVTEAYEAGKYAFVSDYVRLCVLAEYGGIYLDTDTIVVKDFGELLEGCSLVLGYENEHSICMGFVAAEANNPVIIMARDSYANGSFYKTANELDLQTINRRFTKILLSQGINISERIHREAGNIQFYTSDYFSGQDLDHGHRYVTENTYVIQENAGSWGKKEKGVAYIKTVLKYKIIRPGLQKLLGYEKSDKLLDYFATMKKPGDKSYE